MEPKFLVLKWEDIEAALIPEDRTMLALMIAQIQNYRWAHHKQIYPEYLVVNVDEPYAPLVRQLIEKGNTDA